MRHALIGDIHANLPALEAVLADIDGREDVGAVYHLGDLVGYAPWPDEVVAALRERAIAGVAGNYDSTTATDYEHCGCRYEDPRQEELSHLSYEWTRANVAPETKAWLGSLPFRIDLRPLGGHTAGPRLILVHGNPVLNTVYWTEDRSDGFCLQMAGQLGAKPGDVVAFGHTHRPWHRTVEGIHFVNTGSVGRPRDGDWRAGYVLVDMGGESVEVEFVRVEYDLERAASAIRESELPDDFAEYLETGGMPEVPRGNPPAAESPTARTSLTSQGPGDRSAGGHAGWPPLPLAAWNDTRHTLHMWTQIVGKIRLALAPMENHWWQVPLYVTADGLTTSPMPYDARALQIDFDLVEHRLRIRTSDGQRSELALEPRSVADFHEELMGRLSDLDMRVEIDPRPNEVADPVPFDQDHASAAYDAAPVERFFAALRQADRLMKRFRSGFLGKVSPVHFFWGSFDHAVTRFSGRGAPPHPGGIPNLPDWVTREAYNRELSSAGFWPGDARLPEPAFYAYAYPEPAGFRAEPAGPEGAYHHEGLGEFVLPYEAVRSSPDPDAAVLEFLESTYAAAARTGGWDRAELERNAPTPADVKRMDARLDRAGRTNVAST